MLDLTQQTFWRVILVSDIRYPGTEPENRDDQQKQNKTGFVSGVQLGPLAAKGTN